MIRSQQSLAHRPLYSSRRALDHSKSWRHCSRRMEAKNQTDLGRISGPIAGAAHNDIPHGEASGVPQGDPGKLVLSLYGGPAQAFVSRRGVGAGAGAAASTASARPLPIRRTCKARLRGQLRMGVWGMGRIGLLIGGQWARGQKPAESADPNRAVCDYRTYLKGDSVPLLKRSRSGQRATLASTPGSSTARLPQTLMGPNYAELSVTRQNVFGRIDLRESDRGAGRGSTL